MAPCDNIGEIASPVFILVAIGLEGLIDALPIERAPYLADANDGILGAWRAQRFRGEAPIMMAVALAVRVISCWVELTIRARMRHGSNDDAGNNLGSSDGNADVSGDGERVAAMGSNSRRRASTAVLYNRIVRSQEAPVAMQYLTGGSFALQAIQFVPIAANIGRGNI